MPVTTLSPLREQPSRLSEDVYDAVVRAIVDHRLAPGEALSIVELAEQLGVSRTPVRYALSRLEAEGLVSATQRGWFSITNLNDQDVSNLWRVRLMYELFALDEGMANLTPALLADMEAAASACATLCVSTRIEDSLASFAADLQFHRLIVGLAQNHLLLSHYAKLNTHLQMARAGRSHLSPGELRSAYEQEHGAILSALATRDLAAAKEAVRAHIANSTERTVRRLHNGR